MADGLAVGPASEEPVFRGGVDATSRFLGGILEIVLF